MSAACGAGTEKQRGTRVRPGAPADGRPTTPSLRDCLWTPATNAWPVTSVWAHGGASTAAVNHTNLAENYGTLCRRRSSAQPAQMQLLAPRLLEAASSTSRQVSRQASQAAFIGSACNGLFPRHQLHPPRIGFISASQQPPAATSSSPSTRSRRSSGPRSRSRRWP